jgi:hypothetical protein
MLDLFRPSSPIGFTPYSVEVWRDGQALAVVVYRAGSQRYAKFENCHGTNDFAPRHLQTITTVLARDAKHAAEIMMQERM